MRVLIIEDELPARAKLEDMLKKLQPDAMVVARLGSVAETIRWLTANTHPDLAFVDIQLSDDHSFEIFRQHPVKFPVIFTTAYDKYLLESFEFNSIDYLLKPITEEKLGPFINKNQKFGKSFSSWKYSEIDSGRATKKPGHWEEGDRIYCIGIGRSGLLLYGTQNCFCP